MDYNQKFIQLLHIVTNNIDSDESGKAIKLMLDMSSLYEEAVEHEMELVKEKQEGRR